MQVKEVSLFMGSVCHKGASNNGIPFVTIASCTENVKNLFITSTHQLHTGCITFCAKTLSEYTSQRAIIIPADLLHLNLIHFRVFYNESLVIITGE